MGHERPALLAMRLFTMTEPKRVLAVTKHVFLLGLVSFFLPKGFVLLYHYLYPLLHTWNFLAALISLPNSLLRFIQRLVK